MLAPVAFLEGVGGPELLFIGVLALLMFGSKRLPVLGRSFGRAMREFKRATSGVEENLREVMREDPKPRIRPPKKRTTPPQPTPSPAAEPSPPEEPKESTFSDTITDDFSEDLGNEPEPKNSENEND